MGRQTLHAAGTAKAMISKKKNNCLFSALNTLYVIKGENRFQIETFGPRQKTVVYRSDHYLVMEK